MSPRRWLLFVACALAGAFAWWLLARRAREPAELERTTPPAMSAQRAGEAQLESLESATSGRAALDPLLQSAEVPATPNEGTPAATQTRDMLHFFGRAVDATDGVPVPGISVEVGDAARVFQPMRGALATGGPDPQALRTDARGLFEAVVPKVEACFARLDGPNWSHAYVQLGPGHESSDRALRIEMLRPAAIEFDVRTTANSPVMGAELRVGASTWALLHAEQVVPLLSFGSIGRVQWSAITDQDGRCTIHGLPPHVALNVEHQRGQLEVARDFEAALLPGETRRIEVRIGAGARLEGIARDARGVEIPGLALWLTHTPRLYPLPWCFEENEQAEGRRTAMTDAVGRFHFDDLSIGDWAVAPAPRRAENGDAGRVALAQPFTIASGEEVHEIELRVPDPLFVRGHVLGPSNEPVPGVSVSVQADSAACWGHAESGQDGSFAIGPLPEGTYLLKVNLALDLRELLAPEPLSVPAGASDIWVRLLAGCRIAGDVVGPDGEPVGAIRYGVKRIGSEAPGFMAELNFSSSNNSFGVGGLSPGRYSIVARAGEFIGALTDLQLEAAQPLEGLRLRIDRGATLRLRCPKGATERYYTVECAGVPVSSGVAVSGASSAVIVLPGQVLVRAGASPFELTQELHIRVAAAEELELVLEAR